MKRVNLLIAVITTLAACGPVDRGEAVGETTSVIRKLKLGRENPEGVAPGFDLDGWVSDERDDRACRQPDFVDTFGRPGIDNQLALLLPLIDIAGEGALDNFVQTAINEGRFLIFFRLVEREDGSHDLVIERGEDVPLLGTDGLLLPGQTLARHAEPMLGKIENVSLTDGELVGGPFPLRFLIVVFSRLYQLDLSRAYVRFKLDHEGALTDGVIGGAVTLEQIFDIVGQANELVGADLEALFGDGIRDLADIEREQTGTCRSISMGVTFEGAPAFMFE